MRGAGQERQYFAIGNIRNDFLFCVFCFLLLFFVKVNKSIHPRGKCTPWEGTVYAPTPIVNDSVTTDSKVILVFSSNSEYF